MRTSGIDWLSAMRQDRLLDLPSPLQSAVEAIAIGQNQGIQQPSAERWLALEAAWLKTMKASAPYDAGRPCGAEANGAKCSSHASRRSASN
jgi:alkylation response protein AidB-like acyl-CoA dehydrogenase